MGLIFLSIALIIMFSGYHYLHKSFNFQDAVADFYANIGAELASIAITIIIVDKIIRRKEKQENEEETRKRLLRQVHSTVNDIAKAAVDELRGLGKLTGADAWVANARLGGKADLRNARLYDANFQGTRLVGADFSDADLRNVNFKGADLTGCIFYKSNIANAKFDNTTVMPNGEMWAETVEMGIFTTQSYYQGAEKSWLKVISNNEIEIDEDSLMALPVTAKNLIFYLEKYYKEGEVDVAEDELHFERHWDGLLKYNYRSIGEVHTLLERTEKIRNWVWNGKSPQFKIVHISFAIAIENPSHLELPHWNDNTRERILEARKQFGSLKR